MDATHYLRLGIAGKQAAHRARMREASVICPVCDTQTTPRDLLQHLALRCPGRAAPHPGSAWVTWREALAMLPKQRLSTWVIGGLVRYKGDVQDRRYLLRDLVMCLAWLKFRRDIRSSVVAKTRPQQDPECGGRYPPSVARSQHSGRRRRRRR